MQTLFPKEEKIFQDDNGLNHAAGPVRSGASIRNRCPPPASLLELSQYLLKESYNIPLNSTKHAYESIPRRIHDLFNAKDGPTSY
ncbi:hypothetical protein TNCV_4262341 [Trichonephila clavipes]|nr:hypothetical protein TNCV_4262341 [Trichonephila clavipes]